MTNYHELVKGKVYIGGVDAIQDAVNKHGITEVFDLRARWRRTRRVSVWD